MDSIRAKVTLLSDIVEIQGTRFKNDYYAEKQKKFQFQVTVQ